MPEAIEVHRALTRVLDGRWTLQRRLRLDQPHRIVILSDMHKGAGDRADEFKGCSQAYTTALRHYLAQGYSLVLLGDVEDLWENRFSEVLKHHRAALELEREFGPDRYIRIWGNHDDKWMESSQVSKHLAPWLPVSLVHEALRFEAYDGGQRLGTLFLVHGHQGTFGSDKLRPIARLALRYFYRPILQNIFGIGKQSPSTDACLRGEHDRTMYGWARQQSKLILIAGHTHRPVWMGLTHLQQLELELQALQAAPRPNDPAYAGDLAALQAKIVERRAKYPPCNDRPTEVSTAPCYFNTGCCKFSDCDITGIELVDGVLRLVKWSSGGGAAIELEFGPLAACFRRM